MLCGTCSAHERSCAPAAFSVSVFSYLITMHIHGGVSPAVCLCLVSVTVAPAMGQ